VAFRAWRTALRGIPRFAIALSIIVCARQTGKAAQLAENWRRD
jgi:hypothetical protein